MSKRKLIIFVIMISTVLTSCGFKKINQDFPKIHIKILDITGENRVAYKLKNNILMMSDEKAEKKYELKLNVLKTRSNKIRNKSGKVTRYILTLKADLTFNEISSQRSVKKVFVQKVNYNVARIHSKTISNEKNATKNVVQQLSDEIKNFIIISVKN